eukprot:g7001.t1
MAQLTWIYPVDEKFDLSRYKELYFHYKDWKKPGWISHRRYIPNPIPFKGPGVVVNVTVSSGLPPGEFDITRYEKLYLKKVAEEKSKIGLFKRKGKFWRKVDKSPIFSKNRKKLDKGITLSTSNAIDKSLRDEKKKRVKNRLRADSMSKKLKMLKVNINRENSGGDSSHTSPQTSPSNMKGGGSDVFNNVDSEITAHDMMNIFTPRHNNSNKKKNPFVQEELDLSLMAKSMQ